MLARTTAYRLVKSLSNAQRLSSVDNVLRELLLQQNLASIVYGLGSVSVISLAVSDVTEGEGLAFAL